MKIKIAFTDMLSPVFAIAVLTLFPLFSSAQCVIDSGVPPIPGIYPPVLSDADGCEFYEMDVTFFLPRDTSVTVAGQTITVPFNYFSIDSITNLPPGLSWECNLDSCVYVVHPDSANVDTLGCIRIFGTPSTPGYYPMTVHFTANVIVFGNPNDQLATYNAPLRVGPCPFVGDCYTLNVNSLCEPAMLDITNNIPSNGNQGYSYAWDITGPAGFAYTTSDENPFSQVLSDAGDYVVDYEVTIDTSGFFLNTLIIDSVDCTDLLDAGDIYWYMINPNGDTILNTSSNPITNGGNSVPINIGLNTFKLDTGTYEFQVWDADQIGNDDGCATNTGGSGASVFFNVPPPNTGNLTVINSGLRVILNIDNPIEVITCTDTITIDSVPATPVVMADTSQICAGDSVLLTVMTSDSVQWYFNSVPITEANGTGFYAKDAGFYYAESIDRNTLCFSASGVFELTHVEILAPSIAFDGNFTLTIASPNAAYSYAWYDENHVQQGSGTSWMPSASGNYYAVAIDTATGCQSAPSATIQTILSSIDEIAGVFSDFNLYPNPHQGNFQVEWSVERRELFSLTVTDLFGRTIWRKNVISTPGTVSESVNLNNVAPGIYFFSVNTEQGALRRKMVITR